MEREEFDRINVFGLGNENIDYAQYFIGKSYLNWYINIIPSDILPNSMPVLNDLSSSWVSINRIL